MDLLKKPPREWGQFEGSDKGIFPSVNFIDNGEKFIVELVAPGMNIKDFVVVVKNNQLWIEGYHNEKPKAGNYITREYPHDLLRFRRSFQLGEDISQKDFYKTYSQGILKIVFSKVVQGRKPARYELIKSN